VRFIEPVMLGNWTRSGPTTEMRYFFFAADGAVFTIYPDANLQVGAMDAVAATVVRAHEAFDAAVKLKLGPPYPSLPSADETGMFMYSWVRAEPRNDATYVVKWQ
jgi:hypothetical protein